MFSGLEKTVFYLVAVLCLLRSSLMGNFITKQMLLHCLNLRV